MKRKAIIIGATGRVGQALTHELIALYDTVTVISRTQPDFFSANMQCYTLSDFANLSASLSALSLDDKTDAFCCLWLDKADAISDEALKQVHYEYPYEFAVLAAQKGVRRFYLLSKAGASLDSRNPLLKLKAKLEQAICALKLGDGAAAFDSTVSFRVDKLSAAKSTSLSKTLSRQAKQWANRLIYGRALTPEQVAAAMMMVAYQQAHQPFFSQHKPNLRIISHDKMLKMGKKS